jgi:quercetin dioxygenase-like cupin family protein
MNRSTRILCLALLSLFASSQAKLGAQAASATYSPPANSTPLTSTFVDWDSLKFKSTPVGLYCAVFDQPTSTLEKIELHVTTLFPGKSPHSPHHHPWEEIFLIKEGQLEVSINGRKQTAGPGAMAFIASHDVHNVTNTGDKPATYYVMTFCSAAVRTVRDQPAAEWAPNGTLSSQVVDCDSVAPPAGGGHKTIFDSPTLTLLEFESHVSTLKPGASTTPRNRDPGEELFIVKSGVLEVTLNGISSRMTAGSFYYVAPNDERTMKNIGTQPCSYQVIKVVSDRSPCLPGPG